MLHSSAIRNGWILVLFSILLVNKAYAQIESTYLELDIVSIKKSEGSDIFELKSEQLTTILTSRPTKLKCALPDRNGQLITILFTRVQISRKLIKDQVFYQGKISGNSHSLASITFTKKGISGFISDQIGNFSYQTLEGRLLIKEPKTKNELSDWTCHNSPIKNYKSEVRTSYSSYKSSGSDTISIYFECDYSLFELHSFSITATENYVYSLFNQVQAIYAQEGIEIIIENIKVWDEPDPYDPNSVESALLDFREHIGTSYNGTFAHLLSGNANLSGGIAFTNGLCNRDKSYAYSNLDLFIDPHGEYSWDVHVVAHEIGHNFGSPHTHDCAWGPSGNEAIDACGAPAAECENAPIPSEGGTIMSYCHTAPVGVNFSLGFGQEPGDLIRSMIDLCREEEGDVCASAIRITESGIYDIATMERGSGASHSPATHAQWYSFIAPSPGNITIKSCGQGVDTRLYLYSGNCTDLNEVQNSDDDCLSGGGYNYASLLEYSIIEGASVLIEWDDRWSSEVFEFEFTFVPDPVEHCSNGVQDMDETGIDCGGSCIPCQPPPCEDESTLPAVIHSSTLYSTMSAVNFDGIIHFPAQVDIRSGQAINLNRGFQIKNGASLKAIIEDCTN